MYVAVRFNLVFACFLFPSTALKTFLKSKKARLKVSAKLSSTWVRGEHLKMSEQQNMVRNIAVQVRRGEVKS